VIARVRQAQRARTAERLALLAGTYADVRAVDLARSADGAHPLSERSTLRPSAAHALDAAQIVEPRP
jgi:hypothetical protein